MTGGWLEIWADTKYGQTSIIKPSNFPDVPDDNNVGVFVDGRKAGPECYRIECEGALVVFRGEFHEDMEVCVRYKPHE